MAAERAAELAEKAVRVVPSRSQQAGLAAAVALRPDADAPANAAEMTEAIDAVRTGAVAPAARPDAAGRFAIGEAVGFVDDDVVAWGEPAPTLEAVLAALSQDAELVTCFAGEGAPLDADEAERQAGRPGVAQHQRQHRSVDVAAEVRVALFRGLDVGRLHRAEMIEAEARVHAGDERGVLAAAREEVPR